MNDSAEGRAAEHRVFLIADIRGYTKYTDEYGDEAAGVLAARFAELAKQAVEAHEGVLLELRGDEALAHFVSARQALRAAVELQKLVAGQLPRRIGIGIDAGEAVAVSGGYRGTALNVAARLCARAAPGEILATDTVVHLAAHIDGARYVEPRTVRLSGLDTPVRIVGVVAADSPEGRSQRTLVGALQRVDRRVAVAGVALLGVVIATFVILRIAPGGSAAPPSTVARVAVNASLTPGLPSASATPSTPPPASSTTGSTPVAAVSIRPRSSGPPPADWTMYRGDAARDGQADAGPVGQPVVRWTYQTSGSFNTVAAVVGGIVYAISDDAVLHAIDDDTGTQLWDHPDAHTLQGPTVANGAVYVDDSAGLLHALDATTGQELWHSIDPVPGFMTPTAGYVYVGTTGAIVALDAASGSERWRYDAASAAAFHPPAVADGVVYAGSDAGGLFALDAATGDKRWHADIAPDDTGSTAVAADGIVYLADSVAGASGHLTAFNAQDGTIVWQINEVFGSPAVAGGVAYSGNAAGIVVARDAASDKELWRFQADGPTAPLVVAAGIVYVGAGQHRISALDGKSGAELWHFDLEAGVPAPIAVTHGSVYVGSSAGTLYALTSITAPAKFLWQATADGLSFPAAIALAPDGQIWVADTDNDRFAIFNPDGTFVEYWGTPGEGDGKFQLRRANGDGYGAVAFAPDGSFYVLDVGNRRVQRFDKQRRFVKAWGEFGSGPGEYTDPVAIVVDDNGLIHVLDDLRNVVETYDNTGRVLGSFDLPLAANSVNAMTIDASGNVYVTACCRAGNRVRKYDRAGNELSTFGGDSGAGHFTDQPGSIALDAAGRLFVDQGELAIGNRILVFDGAGGFLTSFADKGSGDGQVEFPSGLILDNQGNLYLADAATNRLQKFQLLPPLAPE